MKIVHCIFSFNTGGAETMLCDIICRQARNNDVTLIVVNNDYDKKQLDSLPDGVAIYLLDRNPGGRSPLFILRFNRLLRKLHPDVINLHSYLLPRVIFGQKNKLWYTVHAINIPMTYSHKLHGVIAISEAVKDNIKDKCKCKIQVIPNGIDIEKIERKNHYQVKNAIRVVQVARLYHEVKGQDLLIQAIAELKKKGITDIFVDFIGEGPSESGLKQLVADLNVDDQIRFLGLKDRDYIYSHLRDYDIMCLPSRLEGFGLVIAEGLAAGLPVLVSDIPGPMEVIEGGKLGCSFESGNAKDLAEKLKHMITHYNDYVNMANFAYNRIKENYSIDRMVKEYLVAYEQ